MCGIVGYVGHREVLPLLLDGLKKLEYRGYDSAGVVTVTPTGFDLVKAEGKLERLRERLQDHETVGTYGLGHTRWATHGPPVERNAHPILDDKKRVAVIHNGIIENFLEIKSHLLAEGWHFHTDTDTEVIANLISSKLEQNGLLESVALACRELEGMYALAAVTTESEEPEILVARHGPPLLLGLGEGEQFLASDPTPLLAYTRDVIFLDNGDIARLRRHRAEVFDFGGKPVDRQVHHLNWDPVQIEKGGYKHFMLKEIHDQPQALQDTLAGRVNFERGRIGFEDFSIADQDLAQIRRIHLLACGTSWHAALVGKFLIEELARIPVGVDYGSEYRYRDPIVDSSVLAIGISQSGETADTLAAMEAARERGGRLLSICNVAGSQATRISEGTIYTHAGPEIGVASTKAFTTQLVAIYLLALYLRQARGLEVSQELIEALAHLPQAVARAIDQEAHLTEIAKRYHRARDFLYIGRGINYPIALEGALKLKEISYIHAEGYPAGEMKHGPIALIDEDLPTVAIATGDSVADKVRSNMEQVKARDGQVIAVTDLDPQRFKGLADEVIVVPRTSRWLQPIVNVVPLQLLAYDIGVRRGCDVDQPRNLAKSVTVE